MRIITSAFALLLSLAALAQHTNIEIMGSGSPSEPSIMINPKNPRYVVAGSILNYGFFSSDTGRTWQTVVLNSPFGVWGDPAITVDTNGYFYYSHLSNPPGAPFIDRIITQKSTTNGASWGSQSFTGLNGNKAQDKEWSIVDRTNNNIYLTWSQFDVYGSANPADSTHIMFSRSTDQGATWTTAQRINKKGGDCVDGDNTVEGAVPAVGPAGQVYVAWAGPDGLVFDRSLDGGNTWLANDITIGPIPGGWDYSIPGVDRCNGLPITVCDLSNGPNRGTIYVNWSDQRNGAGNTDVWLTKSTDGGNTWSLPAKVNDDAGSRHQFLTWMAIDQTNGYLYFVFYDRRNYADNQTDVYMARSKDGGASFQNFKVSASPFIPSASVFFGDYTNVSVHNGIIRPIWSRMVSGQTSILTALVDTMAIPGVTTSVDDLSISPEMFQAYPNPFDNESFVSFKLREAARVTLEVYDLAGRKMATPLAGIRLSPGKYTKRIDGAANSLPSGAYIYVLRVNNKMVKRKVIRVN